MSQSVTEYDYSQDSEWDERKKKSSSSTSNDRKVNCQIHTESYSNLNQLHNFEQILK